MLLAFFKLRGTLLVLLKIDHMIVAAYYTKLKGLWDELGPIMTLFVLVE